MSLFHPDNSRLSPEHAKVWAAYEIAHTLVDFSAAGLFVVGSILFFYKSTTYAATWMFLVGSIFFGMKPTIRLLRELKFLRMGRYAALAEEVDG
ncbi:YrhK family protein [Solirhodobacter olei]|uniref:YrhK family protein n=1 Tax=Solirhodobacter olei TaxID=2493082 RepID=UPI000FD86936|nr:YrhK family protein [Solirhodobacter olei]